MGEVEDAVRANHAKIAAQKAMEAEAERQRNIEKRKIAKVHGAIRTQMIREIISRIFKELEAANYPEAELLVFGKTWFTKGREFACWVLPPVDYTQYQFVLRSDRRFFTRQDFWWRNGVHIEIIPELDHEEGRLLLRVLREWHHSRKITKRVIEEFYATGRFDSELIHEFGLSDPNSVN